MKHPSILTPIVFVLAVSAVSAQARAEDRLSLKKWSQDFESAVESNNSKKIQQLLDFDSLDKKITKCEDCDTKATLEKARKVYAQGKYDEARELYNQISKDSPYWLQAVEEKGWTYFRQNQLEDSLAQAKTLLSPQFASFVGAEAYFLQSLAQLKSCNYKAVFETNRLFKEKQKARLVEIQNLTETGMNEALKETISSVKHLPLSFDEVGKNAKLLPHLFYKDIAFQKQLMRFKLSEKALDVLAESASPAGLEHSLRQTHSTAETQLQKRMKELAAAETEDNFKIVQKLNLVEVEAVQRLHHDLELDKDLFKKGEFKKTNADQLVFVDDGRPWIDELDRFQVRVKSCPDNIRRKM